MEGQVALVTGGTKGIGLQIAKQLAQKGIHVIFTARTEVQKATQEVREAAAGSSVDFVVMDVNSDKDIESARDFVSKKYGKLDILINNAAIATLAGVSVRDEFLATYNANVAGIAVILDTFYELLKKSAHPRVVNVSSSVGSLKRGVDAIFPADKGIAYRATKAALNLLTVIYSQKFKEVKINAICPGYCNTELNGFSGYRDPAVGANVAVKLALEDKESTGSFFEISDNATELTVVPW